MAQGVAEDIILGEETDVIVFLEEELAMAKVVICLQLRDMVEVVGEDGYHLEMVNQDPTLHKLVVLEFV